LSLLFNHQLPLLALRTLCLCGLLLLRSVGHAFVGTPVSRELIEPQSRRVHREQQLFLLLLFNHQLLLLALRTLCLCGLIAFAERRARLRRHAGVTKKD
jgi:hypothetical protein